MKVSSLRLLLVALSINVSLAAADDTVSLSSFANYQVSSGISGSLKSVGSDTMNNLMTFWMEGFHRHYPNVQTQVEGKGSSTAPPALMSGTANLGPMSRPMKASEIDNFKKKFGFEPTPLYVGIDMIAIYVHKDNPLESVTMAQLDAIFSKSSKAGYRQPIRTWGDLGLKGPWASKTISLYGRNSASGTYGYVKENVLLGGDYRDSVKEQPGSSSVVQAVGSDKFGIGYSGIGFKTDEVKALALALTPDDEPIPAEAQFAYSGDYPLARLMLVYLNHRPGSELDPLRREFVRFIYSQEGQSAVVKDGCLPVTPAMMRDVYESVGIEPPASE